MLMLYVHPAAWYERLCFTSLFGMCQLDQSQAHCCLSTPAAQEAIDGAAHLQATPAEPSAAPAARARYQPAFLTKKPPE